MLLKCWSTSYSHENHLILWMCHAARRIPHFHCSRDLHAAMKAYDHYVAICNPLLYVVSRRVCLLLVFFTYLFSFVTGIFCGTLCVLCFLLLFQCNQPLLLWQCPIISSVLLRHSPSRNCCIFSATNLFFSMIIVLVSYFNIILAILRICSSEARKKRKPSLLVLPTWWLWLCSTAHFSSCICNHGLITP